MKKQIEKAIKEMVKRIVRQFQPEKIILFGSHARGTSRSDSDIDLLVVMSVKGFETENATADTCHAA